VAVTYTPLAGANVGQAGAATGTTITIPAAGVPIGARVIVFGCRSLSQVTDARGNVYTIRFNANGGWCADAPVSTALVSGDKITITLTGTFQFCCYAVRADGLDPSSPFDGGGAQSFTGSAAAGPLVTTTLAGDLVIGAFYAQTVDTQSDPVPIISAVGSGYTDQTGVGNTGSTGNWPAQGMDWEAKIAGAAGNETPTATLNVTAGTLRTGMTMAYRAPGSAAVAMVV